MIYGAALPPLTVSYSGFENGDTPANLSTAPTLTTMATTSSHVGSYDISASGAVDPDYTIAYVDGSLSITPASLTITADNQTNVYGATLPTLTASYTGFVNGDTSASLTTLPTLSTTATSASHVADGPYAITASNAVDADYSITYVAGSLTVTTAPLLITADNQTKVYGAALPTLTASYTGFVNGDTSESLTAQPSLSTTATAASDAGGYTITASGAVDSDYSISYASGTLTITQAALTITADDQSKVYGEELPTLTASYSGFVNGDTAANLDIGPTLSTTATTNSDVGVYSITVSGAADVDYTITFVSGTLTVTSAALTITADNQTKVYGAALPMLTASYSGFVNGDTSASLTTLPTVTTTATASSDVLGSPYSITASGAADTNYTITYVAGTLTVTPATLSAVADNLSRPEGQANPPLTYTIFGLVNGDTTSVISGAPNLSTTATTASFDGQYPITITVGTLSAANYDFNTVDGIMTVTETPDTTIVLTANPGSTSTYGQSITFTATFIPFDSEAVPPTGTVAFEIDGTPIGSPVTLLDNTATSESISSLYVGLHTVEANYTGDSFYDPNSQSMTQTVTPAPLLITADNQTKVYGAAVPTLTASYSGFVNDDTPASLSTLPVLGTTATVSSDVSGNPYTITASGAVDNNYTISYVAGSLTITPAALTITADNQTSVYGAGLPVLTASYSGFVAGDTAANLSTAPTLTTMATTSSHVGSYDISASGAVDPDYTIAYVDGSLSITPASLTITADNQTNVYGATLPTLTASYTGFVNGDTSASLTTLPTLSTTATSASHVGDGPYAITASNAVDADYSITYVEGSLTVTAASLLITADNQTKVYGAALPTLTASYTGFVNGDTALSLTTQPSLSTTATAASDAGGYTITASGAVDSDYSISYASGTLTITQAALTITADNQSKVYGARIADSYGQLQWFRQRRHGGKPRYRTHAQHDRHDEQRRRRLFDHRQWCRRCRLHHHVCKRHTHRDLGGVDNHRRQPDQGLRSGVTDADRVVLRLRERGHLGQLDDSAHRYDDRNRQQRRLGQSVLDHGERSGGHELHDHVRGRDLDRHSGDLDRHRR